MLTVDPTVMMILQNAALHVAFAGLEQTTYALRIKYHIPQGSLPL